MPKGIKQTSSPLYISAQVVETSINTFTTETIELALNPLDNEVFVVTQVNIDVDHPDASGSKTTATSASLSSTARTSIGSIANSNNIATAKRSLVVDANGGVAPFDREDPLFAAMSQEYLAIVATPNMHLQVQGTDNQNTKGVSCRIYGYRATADASVYAALVQSELLSE